ncbi:MAG: hypothetical protein Q6M54_08550, partial [Thermostichus sp. DRC_bins_24]
MIVIDGLAWQSSAKVPPIIGQTWLKLVEQWVTDGKAQDFAILVRGEEMPPLPKDAFFSYIPAYKYEEAEEDRFGLQSACDQLDAKLFVSTHYTVALKTPSIAAVYDLQAEKLERNDLVAQEKKLSILTSVACLCFSDWVLRDLKSYYPGIPSDMTRVVYPGIHSDLRMISPLPLKKFRQEHGLERPYVIFRA